jgi:hypothetical protein
VVSGQSIVVPVIIGLMSNLLRDRGRPVLAGLAGLLVREL